jgi:protein-L-isoaspartate(D-aspartate) O-methyltransferase
MSRHELEQMVATQLVTRGIRDQRVLRAMRTVDRARFTLSSEYAYADGPLPIGFDQTISQPFIVALMTEALALKPGERMLEVGVGSGYQTAILCEMGVEVFGVERIPGLAVRAAKTLKTLGYRARIAVADGTLGWPGRAPPFDAALAAAAAPGVPRALLDQLRPGGRLVIPIGERYTQHLDLVRKRHDGGRESKTIEFVRFVPLVGKDGYRE